MPVSNASRAAKSRFTRDGLSREGFEGWATFADLREANYSQVPAETRGVYVILRPSSDHPAYLEESIAGWFKHRDPSVKPEELADNWVPGAVVVYIGKADWRRRNKNPLRQRLKEFARIGAGRAVNHWGGRLIWQLQDSSELLVAWKGTPGEDPKLVEDQLIADFRSAYGKPPFANNPHLRGR